MTAKERAIIRSVSPVDGKYDTAVDRESAEEVLARKILDKAVDEKKETPSALAPALKAGLSALVSSGVSWLVATAMGKKSRANPIQTGLTAVVRSSVVGTLKKRL